MRAFVFLHAHFLSIEYQSEFLHWKSMHHTKSESLFCLPACLAFDLMQTYSNHFSPIKLASNRPILTIATFAMYHLSALHYPHPKMKRNKSWRYYAVCTRYYKLEQINAQNTRSIWVEHEMQRRTNLLSAIDGLTVSIIYTLYTWYILLFWSFWILFACSITYGTRVVVKSDSFSLLRI